MIRICFVCHGNICRSPFAEALARKATDKRGWGKKLSLDSAGTSAEHLGEEPYHLSLEVGKKMGLKMSHQARQFEGHEFDNWDYVIALDPHNARNLKNLTDDPEAHKKITLLRDWDAYATSQTVPDPWGRGPEAFEEMAEIISSALVEFYDHLKKTHKQL
jgi:protein-tyrosine phosphatase